MRLVHREVVQIGDDASLTQKSCDIDLKEIIDNYTRTTGRTITALAASASDQALPLGLITTVKFIWMRVSAAVTVKFNGAASTAQRLVPGPQAGGKATLMWEGDNITSILLGNPSTAAAVAVEYCLAGD